MTNVDHYTYRITWSAEDEEFVGLIAEFPSLSWLAASQIDALTGIRELVGTVVAEMEHAGELAPEPFADRRYSGQFKLRIPPELHRALAIRAAEENVSLNRLVSSRLTPWVREYTQRRRHPLTSLHAGASRSVVGAPTVVEGHDHAIRDRPLP